MFMTNIPRRKIYEKMLEYEEYVMEIQILARSEEAFKKYKDKYPDSLKNVIEKYMEIKALLVMFFENREFEKEEDFTGALMYYLENEKEVNDYLKKKKRLTKDFKKLILDMDKVFKEKIKLSDYKSTKNIFVLLDAFNSQIPEILQIRRDEMN